jgi:hypothetical protein
MCVKILSGLIFVCLFAHSNAFSQNNTIPAKRDTNIIAPKKTEVVKDSARLAIEEMPRIAARRSAILPGLGQIYNKRWWKVPLVYGGFFGIGLVYEFNQRNYKIFLKEAQFRQENPGETQNPLYAPYTTEGIINIKDAYRRNRDLSILGGLGFYAINIIDAYIDAKFFRFDLSDELSIQVKPSVNQTLPVHASASGTAVGLKLKISL